MLPTARSLRGRQAAFTLIELPVSDDNANGVYDATGTVWSHGALFRVKG